MAHYCSKLASAEFTQIDHILDLSTNPEDYLEIVKGKQQDHLQQDVKEQD